MTGVESFEAVGLIVFEEEVNDRGCPLGQCTSQIGQCTSQRGAPLDNVRVKLMYESNSTIIRPPGEFDF